MPAGPILAAGRDPPSRLVGTQFGALGDPDWTVSVSSVWYASPGI
jgi:hypothetical protein